MTLNELNISETAIGALCENALGLAKVWRLREYGQQEIASILRLCC